MNRRMIQDYGFGQKIQLLVERIGWKIKEKVLEQVASVTLSGKPLTSRLRRADFATAQIQLLRRYQPQIYHGPMTLILCEELGEGLGFEYNLTYGWEKLALGGLYVMRTPGTHRNMFEEPQVQTLARQVARSLEGKP